MKIKIESVFGFLDFIELIEKEIVFQFFVVKKEAANFVRVWVKIECGAQFK